MLTEKKVREQIKITEEINAQMMKSPKRNKLLIARNEGLLIGLYWILEEKKPCPVCGRVDDNHYFDKRHNS